MSLSRRSFLILGSVTAIGQVPAAARQPAGTPTPPGATAAFPSHDPDVTREIVGASHGNVARVKELLAGRPALANAAWDWGFGDWESALGAASHVGNREIAGMLLAAGARPSIFSAAMLGQLEAVKALIAASPGLQKIKGPHGITLLAHAKAGGAGSIEVVKYLESLGDADIRYRNEPLTDADRAAIIGTYVYGSSPTERLIVAANDRGPSIQRHGAPAARGLLHLGDRRFHPIGGDAVRIRFAAGSPSPSLTIEDGPIVVAATRM